MSPSPDPRLPGLEIRRPEIGPEEARALVAERWGLEVEEAASLPGEREVNFRLRAASGERLVLKAAGPAEDPSVVDLQERILLHLESEAPELPVPRVVPTPEGEEIVVLPGEEGAEGDGDGRVRVRLHRWLEGRPLAGARPRSPHLLESLGRLLGRLDRALRGFEHPALRRPFAWAVGEAPETVRRHLAAVEGEARRRLLEEVLHLHDGRVAPVAGALRRAPIHGDANDHNVLVGPYGTGPDGRRRRTVSGLLDFGDAVESAVAAEPAVAGAYAALGLRNPLRGAASVVRGYHAEHPLEEAEVEALFPLVLLRLAVSVVVSASRREAAEEEAYLRVSEAPAWEALERLREVHPDFARAVFREACGLEPSPASARVVEAVEAAPGRVHPVLPPELLDGERLVFDLSVGSPDLPSAVEGRDTAAFTDLLFRRMREADAPVGIGRYDEPRRWYAGEAYRVPGDAGPERRTVHLGIDLFAEPGTPVLAPLPATVHSLRDNDARLDYGPTVILRHELPEAGGTGADEPDDPDEGGDPSAGPDAAGTVAFHTLYGHLSRSSLEGLEPGDRIEAGGRVGTVGDFPENGDWPPHLHFQIVTELLGREGEFPGVASPEERRVWLSLSPDPNLLLRLPEPCRAEPPRDRREMLEARSRLLGPSLSLSYAEPLEIVRGSRHFLYDAAGREYLDARNNVPHVGHAHPRVVEAEARQAGVLNTNTRYLHGAILRYAERLAATLPEELSVFHFVNSGSEANELALRMAGTATGARGVVVVEGGYHGNTTSTVAISPYKFEGPGGEGAPAWVRVAPMPDPYRGIHREPGPEGGRRYAEEVGRRARELREAGHGVAAFVVEPLPGCAGQIVPPEGYLPAAFRRVREEGGLCVADEVQVGFGRVGSAFWAFEALGAVPDILTLGKPMGNGHPLGAVVTTREVARAFDTGMEYFNTFGGNPVSCRVGLAVLDVIEEEGLQGSARRVGARLLSALEGLRERHPAVGDVRGMGLYLGVELVRDRERREPWGEAAAHLVERAKDRGILLGRDGPDGNVLKIKPPLSFDAGAADRLAATLDDLLAEDFFADPPGGARL